jgi:hypothetical protein
MKVRIMIGIQPLFHKSKMLKASDACLQEWVQASSEGLWPYFAIDPLDEDVRHHDVSHKLIVALVGISFYSMGLILLFGM